MKVQPLKLDLACGKLCAPGFLGVDYWYKDVDFIVDLRTYPWPWDDSSVGEIRCNHYIEHIMPAEIEHGGVTKDSLAAFMDEAFRVLKVGGVLSIVVPDGLSVRGMADFTHRRWFTAESFLYFNAGWRRENGLEYYPISCDFKVAVNYTTMNGSKEVCDWFATLTSLKGV